MRWFWLFLHCNVSMFGDGIREWLLTVVIVGDGFIPRYGMREWVDF